MSEETPESLYNASVAYVVDKKHLAINRGQTHGVQPGHRFLVYALSEEEIEDPATGKSLGQLEIFKGTGRVVHVQDNMAIVESDRIMMPRDARESLLQAQAGPASREILPFEGVQIGDKVKLTRPG